MMDLVTLLHAKSIKMQIAKMLRQIKQGQLKSSIFMKMMLLANVSDKTPPLLNFTRIIAKTTYYLNKTILMMSVNTSTHKQNLLPFCQGLNA